MEQKDKYLNTNKIHIISQLVVKHLKIIELPVLKWYKYCTSHKYTWFIKKKCSSNQTIEEQNIILVLNKNKKFTWQNADISVWF